MIANVSLVGRCLCCDICAAKRSLDELQDEEDLVSLAYVQVSRREEFERGHRHGATMAPLPTAPRFANRRVA